jgi:hypothetical protein
MPAELIFDGPFQCLFPIGEVPYLFDNPRANEPCVYVWTFPTDQGELVHYVHETNDLAKTMYQYIATYLTGKFPILRVDSLAKGNRVPTWTGMLRSGDQYRLAEFLQALPKLSEQLLLFFKDLRIYYALMSDQNLRTTTSTAIGLHIRAQAAAGRILDPEAAGARRGKSPNESYEVLLSGCDKVVGFPRSLQIGPPA